MKNSIYRISMDIHDTSSQISLSVKKGDTARSIYITLTENGKPYKIAEGCSAIFEAKKADGNFIHNACRIEGNTIIYDLTAQTTAAVGATECEIALFDEQGEKLTSPCFIMVVEDTVYNGEEIVSTPEADALEAITDEAKALIADVEEKLANDYFKGETGPQGDKGEQGEKGETPDLGGYIQLWQPNTEYKVDDVVIGDISFDGFYYFQAILFCHRNHTSEGELHEDMRLNLYEDVRSGMWGVKPFISREAETDSEGNKFQDYYATKEELAEAIGQALEGDY